MLSVIIAGAVDREPEELIRAAGMKTTSIGLDGLTMLMSPSASQPNALVVDVRDGAVVPQELAVIRRQHPTTGVVIIAAALEPALLLDAMRAGVNEVVAEPLTIEALREAVGRVAGQTQTSEPGQSFAFIGAKGGVGTTTTAVNVAVSLASIVSKGERVLLVDLQQGGGDASVFVGVEAKFSVQDALDNTRRLDATFLRGLVSQAAPNLDLLAASDVPTGHTDSTKLRAVIDAAVNAYKYVILDVPRANGAVLDSLDHVTRIIVVANQELATVKSASRMATALKARYGRDKFELVVSRSDRQADIDYQDVERAVGTTVGFTFPSDYRAALQALHKGRPLALDAQNELAAAFRRYARKLSGQPDRAEPAKAGLFGRLSLRS